MPSTPTTRTIRLRPSGYERLAVARGWTSRNAAATALGVHRSSLGRALAGEVTAGPALVAALMHATQHPKRVRGLGFFDLFDLSPTDTEE